MPLAVVVALAVDAAAQTGLGKNFFIDLALLAQFHLLLEDIDLAAQLGRNLVGEFFFPIESLFHRNVLGALEI